MISVITPTYNRPDFLLQAIGSFLRQDIQNKEMIIVNDGSSSDYTTVKNQVNAREELKYYEKENGGVASALNFGLHKAKGNFICILADDDLLNGMNSLSERMESFLNDVEVIYTGNYNINVNGEIIATMKVKPVDINMIWQQDYINIQSMMWKKEVHEKIGYFSEDLINNEDWEWKIKCLMECRVKAIDMISVKTRYHGQNKSLINRDMTNKCAGILMERMKKKYGHN